MGTIKDEAKEYESPQTKNIAELEKIPVGLQVEERTGTKKDGKSFTYNVVVVDGEDYRLPNSVLKSLKAILEEKPDLEYFKVKKTGEGLSTEYTIVTLEN